MKRQFKGKLTNLILPLFLILALAFGSILVSCDDTGAETRPQASADTPHISWQNGGLFELLPPPTTEYGSVLLKNDTQLKIKLTHVIKNDFLVYVQLCGEYGYTHSVASSDFLYSAKRQSGERITCQYNAGENTMTFTLDISERMLTPTVTSESLIGLNYADAVEILKSQGFTNVKLYAEAPSEEVYTDGAVVSVTVNSLPLDGTSSFTADSTVFVRYLKTDFVSEISCSDLLGKRVDEVETLLRTAGFTNITLTEIPVRAGDSISPEMNLQVVTVSIGGDPNFERGQTFAPTVPVSVVYYTVIN